MLSPYRSERSSAASIDSLNLFRAASTEFVESALSDAGYIPSFFDYVLQCMTGGLADAGCLNSLLHLVCEVINFAAEVGTHLLTGSRRANNVPTTNPMPQPAPKYNNLSLMLIFMPFLLALIFRYAASSRSADSVDRSFDFSELVFHHRKYIGWEIALQHTMICVERGFIAAHTRQDCVVAVRMDFSDPPVENAAETSGFRPVAGPRIRVQMQIELAAPKDH
jgi:hypothetical protein